MRVMCIAVSPQDAAASVDNEGAEEQMMVVQ